MASKCLAATFADDGLSRERHAPVDRDQHHLRISSLALLGGNLWPRVAMARERAASVVACPTAFSTASSRHKLILDTANPS
jgi:hypothetical protein